MGQLANVLTGLCRSFPVGTLTDCLTRSRFYLLINLNNMYELRIYKLGKNRTRVAKIKTDKPVIGFWKWLGLYKILKNYSVKG